MIERDLDVPDGVDAVRAVGVVTPQDYHDVVAPMLAAAIREHRGLRILCTVDEAFTGVTPAAMWDDVRLGFGAMRHLAGYATVTDLPWVREMTRFSGFFLPGHVRVFGMAERAEALRWLTELPGELAGVRLQAADGVIIVDIDHPLRREDIDLIAAEVDGWLGEHRELPGLVLHAHGFPGWENLSGLLHHVRFVAGHQRRVERLALVVDAPGLDIAARLAGLVLHPEVRHFPVAAEDEAIRWATEQHALTS
ncbi:STAS/SEC14 domain-containing protein [Actinomycetospora endophytica]|uniref:STAS/SEC14 domain-containing protein n=1 Tax=Actinomycetospora endophytica TaxID=2291215 RepID=A0ABS8PAF6_9PSEU|nr:STAS/SEC14 domain-containing protein [Actinomycetospora endophytica]MCD2195261.1 STAS/SEC14 domain-containing protein [Actinomycetospora endophytica]